LVDENPSPDVIRAAVLSADIIYVGGGNTNNMTRIWREKGVDKVLKEALDKGAVLSGISAGANCWFKHYCTDSLALSAGIEAGPETGPYLSMADGLGFIDGICAPHTMTEPMRIPYCKKILLEKYPNDILYGIDDYAAMVFENETIRAVFSSIGKERGSKVRQLFVKNDQIVEFDINSSQPIADINHARDR